jgi:uncharacterized membrane protein YkoI
MAFASPNADSLANMPEEPRQQEECKMNHKSMMFVVMATLLGATSVSAQQTEDEWYRATGKTCSSVDVAGAAKVSIKTEGYNSATMISPDSAKMIALCAVPGQIGSGEMETKDGMTHYAIDIIPNGKKTHAKVIVDAYSGAVLSTKQFGGLRGLAGWVRESGEHKKNATKP